MQKRVALNIVLLVVLAVRSLLPSGFMLQAAADSSGKLEVVICTGSGIKMMTVDENGAPSQLPPRSQHLDHGLCPYAGAGGMTLASADFTGVAGHVEYAAVTYTLAVSQFAETPQPGATSARGPPELI
ncbi:MAG: hypothetical protein IKE66_10450 [Hyphomicrobium sp.]|nr:hypothetical protein [Hyphomicrobium sp.]